MLAGPIAGLALPRLLLALAERDSAAKANGNSSVRHLGIIRVDFEALRRGTVDGDEVCEIASPGEMVLSCVQALKL